MRKSILNLSIYSLVAAFLLTGIARADTVKMKDGKTHEGRVTYEDDSIVKIEVQISASIKESKILDRKDVAEIIKAAPDDVDFAIIQKMVPTKPLLSTDKYKSMLQTGPDAFLAAHPGSKHEAKVKEIKKTLEEELDKVERGFSKIEDVWYSPKEKIDFSTLLESRVKFIGMQAKMNQGNYNGFIGAMRDFEEIEEKYYGAPAHPKAIQAALQIVPALGRQLQGMLRDVEYRNAEFEKNKAILNEFDRKQVEAARAREEQQYQANLAIDKKAGIKWVRLNPQSKGSIEGYLNLAKNELTRIKAFDVEALAVQAEKLVEVDKLIAAGNLDRAKTKLSEAGSSVKKTSSRKKKRSKSTRTYAGALSSKLSTKLSARSAAEKALQEAKESEALAKDLNNTSETPIIPDAAAAMKKKGEGEEGDPVAEEKKAPTEDAFAALSQKKKKKDEPSKTKSTKSSKSKKSSKDDDDKDEDDKKERSRASSGGGFNFQYLIIGFTVIMVLVVVGMKVFGMGGKGDE